MKIVFVLKNDGIILNLTETTYMNAHRALMHFSYTFLFISPFTENSNI